MILVDSSVWIDAFRNRQTPETDRLRSMLGRGPVALGDLILVEILQGTDTERDFNRVRQLLADFPIIEIGGSEIAVQAARNYRRLRSLGITARKTIDTLIATRCIEDGHSLLYRDRWASHSLSPQRTRPLPPSIAWVTTT
ncbi:MAG: PIN domain nuclease [Novosphingobium sp.]|nr:PIN domain nuclease [Novosphingobium sp.]